MDEVAKVNNEVKDEVKRAVENSIGDIKHSDGIVNNKIDAAEKQVKDDLTDKFKGNINDQTYDKVYDMVIKKLHKTVLELQTENNKSRSEIHTVRQFKVN